MNRFAHRAAAGCLLALALESGAAVPTFNIEQRTTEPLLRPNQPASWDQWIGFLNVIRTNDTWHLWYNSLDTNYVNDQDQRLCYASSTNGVDWVKPALGRVNYHGSTSNNIIQSGGVAGAFVFWDGHTDRYRMTVVRDVLPTPPEAYVVFGLDSSNGLDWVEYPDPIFNFNSDTQTTCFWDVDRYRFYPRMWANPALPIFAGTRTIGYCESTTFTNFPAPTQILAPDALDPPNSHYYNNAATKLAENLYVMFISVYEKPGAETQKPHLAVSTNGVDFVRIGHAPVLPLGVGTGSFDSATIYVGPGCTPGPRPDTYWFYYVGNTVNHADFRLPNHGGLGRFLLTMLPEADGGDVPLTYKSGLLTWLRADDLDADRNVTNNPADGTPVAVWKDSNNAIAGNHAAQTNAVNQPTYRATGGPNNTPLVQFDGTNDYLQFPSIAYSNWTLFIVGRMPTGPTHTALAFADYGPNGTTYPALHMYRLTGTGAFRPRNRDRTNHDLFADDTNGWSRFAIRSAWVTNAAMNYRVVTESNTYADAGTPAAGFAPVDMGGDQPPTLGDLPPATGAYAANLELSEFLLYDHTLSAVDRATVEDYLKEKYFPADTNPAPPVVAFSATPLSGPAPLLATFTDVSTGTITNRAWNFGDGQTTNTTAKVLTHDYPTVGTYSVTLTATGPLGTSTVTRSAYIAVQGRPLYWDSDGATAGGSPDNTASGTWGTDNFWNTLSTGGNGTFVTTTTVSDDLAFSAGTDVTGASTVTVNGTQVANSLTVEEGSVTLNGSVTLGAVTVKSGTTLTLTNAMDLPACTFTVNNAASGAECTLKVGNNNSLGGIAGNTLRLMGGANVIYRAKLAPTTTNLVLVNNMEWSKCIAIGAAATAPFKLTGAVTLTDNTILYPDTSSTMDLAGAIAGAYKFTLYPYNNGISVRLSGDNTFSGGFDYTPAVVSTLELARDTAFGTGLVKLSGGNAIVTIRAVDGGFGAAHTYTNALQIENTLYGHNFEGSHTFDGPATLNGAGKFRFTSGGSLSLPHGLGETNGTRTLTLENIGGATGTLTIGPLEGGSGYATLADLLGSRAYTVIAAGNNALGTNLATTVFSSGSTLGFKGNVNYAAAKAITIGGAGVSSMGAIRNVSGTNIFAGPITLSAATTTTNDAGSLTLNGIITDGASAFALTHNGGGTLTLGSANTYDGVTTVKGGVLRLSDTNALPGGIGSAGGTSALTLAGGVLGLGTNDFTRGLGTGIAQVQWTTNGGFAAYGADRIVNLGGISAGVAWGKNSFVPASSALILSAADATHRIDFQNPINLTNSTRTVQVNDGASAIDAQISGHITSTIPTNGGLTKTGNGTLQLTANNTYLGLSSVNSGTLLVNGSQNGAFTVSATAVLGGSGSVGLVSGAGVVSPGGSAGILTASQIDPGSGMGFAFEFTSAGSPDYANAAASSNDVLRITNSTTPFIGALTAANVVNIYFDVPSLTGGESYRGAWYTDNASVDFLSTVSNATYNYYVRGDGLSGEHAFNGNTYYPLTTYNPLLQVIVSRVNEEGTQFAGVDGFVTLFTIQNVSALFTTRGTPYAWLAAHGLVPPAYESADTNDVDADGMTANEEYLAGTDPTNKSSLFTILSISSDFTIRWHGGTNLSNPDFVILRSTNLGVANPWTLTPIAFPRTNGIGGNNVWKDPEGDLYGPNVFYKITAPTNTP